MLRAWIWVKIVNKLISSQKITKDIKGLMTTFKKKKIILFLKHRKTKIKFTTLAH